MQMIKAAVCHEFGSPLTIEEVRLRAPEMGEVEVRLDAVAICHSDISFAEGAWGGTLPAVYGHEAAGRVTAVGAGVAGLAVGDSVAVTLIRACGGCSNCGSGKPTLCETPYNGDKGPLSTADGGVLHLTLNRPELRNAMSLAMVLEAGVHPIFHAWGARPVMDGSRVAGCIFESKEGRRAVLAKVTIDATGDGDLYARAGSGFDTEVDQRDIHGCMNTAWMFAGASAPRRPSNTRSSWRGAARRCGSSNGRSFPGATMSPCSWGRACRAIRR